MRKPSITYEAAVTRAAHNVLIQNSRGVMYVLRMSVTPYFTVCSICSTFSLPFPLSPLSSLLFSFPLISRCPPPPLLYLHVTLISLSTGLWDMCARICVCVGGWGGCMRVCSPLREHELIAWSSFTIVSESVDVSFCTSVDVALESHATCHAIHLSNTHTHTRFYFGAAGVQMLCLLCLNCIHMYISVGVFMHMVSWVYVYVYALLQVYHSRLCSCVHK